MKITITNANLSKYNNSAIEYVTEYIYLGKQINFALSRHRGKSSVVLMCSNYYFP